MRLFTFLALSFAVGRALVLTKKFICLLCLLAFLDIPVDFICLPNMSGPCPIANEIHDDALKFRQFSRMYQVKCLFLYPVGLFW